MAEISLTTKEKSKRSDNALCCLPNCYSRFKTIPLFRIPVKKFEDWERIVNRAYASTPSKSSCNKSPMLPFTLKRPHRICGLHFKSEHFELLSNDGKSKVVKRVTLTKQAELSFLSEDEVNDALLTESCGPPGVIDHYQCYRERTKAVEINMDPLSYESYDQAIDSVAFNMPLTSISPHEDLDCKVDPVKLDPLFEFVSVIPEQDVIIKSEPKFDDGADSNENFPIGSAETPEDYSTLEDQDDFSRLEYEEDFGSETTQSPLLCTSTDEFVEMLGLDDFGIEMELGTPLFLLNCDPELEGAAPCEVQPSHPKPKKKKRLAPLSFDHDHNYCSVKQPPSVCCPRCEHQFVPELKRKFHVPEAEELANGSKK